MFYNIIADNHSFFISKVTLDNHPTCLITQVINNYCSDDKIFVDILEALQLVHLILKM